MATSLEGSAKWVVLVVILLQACLAACDYEMPSEALPTRSGYLDVNTATATSLFYAYYEALEPSDELLKTPVILWLQVRILYSSSYRLDPIHIALIRGHGTEGAQDGYT